MKNRAIQPSPIVRSRKLSAPSKPKNSEAKVKSSARGEGFHRRCSQSPTSAGNSLSSAQSTSPSKLGTASRKPAPGQTENKERSRPPSVKPKPASAISTTHKNSLNEKGSVLVEQSAPPSRLEISQSREDFKKLTTKFSQVSRSILQIASSSQPVGVRSLEALLNLEISTHLADAINDPVHSQGFVQATRHLLEELVRLYEEGKLNPKLLKQGGGKNKTFINANSATSVCYRDQYIKELVMNMLKSMTSSDIEEEVAGKVTRSDESRERIRVIREMVRTEAGLEPEEFKALEQHMDDLRKILSRNKLEMEKAASDVDRIISQHIVKRDHSPISLQVPKPARDALRACSKRLVSGSDEGVRGTCQSGSGCLFRSVVKGGSDKYKKSLEIVGDKECFEKGNSDEIQNIRPQLKDIIHEELLRIKVKEEEILNHDSEFDRDNRLVDTPKGSYESVDFKSAASNTSCDDEGSEETSRTFVENLKSEIKERNVTNYDFLEVSVPQGVCIRLLERIDEDEDETVHRDGIKITESSTSNYIENSSFCLVTPIIDIDCYASCENSLSDSKEISIDDLQKRLSESNVIDRVKSKWIYKEASDVKNVLEEMKDAFDTVADVFSSLKISEDYNKQTGDANVVTDFKENLDFYLWDFTVGELEKVLVNISVKINSLPQYLQETIENGFTEQRKQAFYTFSVLEQCMNPSYIKENNHPVSLAGVSLSVKDFAKTFSYLSDTLKNLPSKMKSDSISVLNPPKSLIETLYTLSSTAYFKECFATVKDPTFATKCVEVVKPYNIDETTSSGEILNLNIINNQVQDDTSAGCRKKIFTHTRDKRRPDDMDKNLRKFEHFMGLTATVMTVQNVSDMFLFLSAVLNDAPERIKTERILDMDPPLTLLKALDILYYDHDDTSFVSDLEKKKSFASLTIQNVSDFLLTLSKTFDDIPERLKESAIADLRPPHSLVRALTLLTSLSHLSIPESYSQETAQVCEENPLADNHEKFFDAVASLE